MYYFWRVWSKILNHSHGRAMELFNRVFYDYQFLAQKFCFRFHPSPVVSALTIIEIRNT